MGMTSKNFPVVIHRASTKDGSAKGEFKLAGRRRKTPAIDVFNLIYSHATSWREQKSDRQATAVSDLARSFTAGQQAATMSASAVGQRTALQGAMDDHRAESTTPTNCLVGIHPPDLCKEIPKSHLGDTGHHIAVPLCLEDQKAALALRGRCTLEGLHEFVLVHDDFYAATTPARSHSTQGLQQVGMVLTEGSSGEHLPRCLSNPLQLQAHLLVLDKNAGVTKKPPAMHKASWTFGGKLANTTDGATTTSASATLSVTCCILPRT